MVANFFVITKVRQTYEPDIPPVMPAQEWSDAGKKDGVQVFGVSNLEIEKISGDEEGDEIKYRADFILWLPENQDFDADFNSNAGSEDAEGTANTGAADTGAADTAWEISPTAYHYTDELRLIRYKGAWRIAEIVRKEK
jgi:hypothetical protein